MIGATITTTYKWEDIDVTLTATDSDYDGTLHYALACMFAKVVSDFNLNPEMFLERMSEQLDIPIQIQNEDDR